MLEISSKSLSSLSKLYINYYCRSFKVFSFEFWV